MTEPRVSAPRGSADAHAETLQSPASPRPEPSAVASTGHGGVTAAWIMGLGPPVVHATSGTPTAWLMDVGK